MKMLKMILSAITVIFALMSLLKILPFDVGNPLMLTSLATLLIVRSLELKGKGDKTGFRRSLYMV